ncbi:DUF429 domain-containing protein [Dehalococcoidia bacterium]|nr:DUF429 domain-containing protein [Dehalococcoidia bacterium]
MIDKLPGELDAQSGVHADHGAVLGVDVGWSEKKATTGLCLIEWTNLGVSLECCEARSDEDDRRDKLDRLIQGRKLLAVGIDGPLIPRLGIVKEYRAADAFLSRGRFQRRGKAGPTNGGSGPKLHNHATQLAKLIINTRNVGPATYPYRIHDKAVVEAFPNAFLSVLHPDEGFPTKPKVKRRWTDTLFPLVKQELWQLLRGLLPQHKACFSLDDIHGHEDRASFLCALTALCVAVARCVAVGNRRLGYIVLPPLEHWGASIAGNGKWARDTLRHNYTSVRDRFTDSDVYKDNELWRP